MPAINRPGNTSSLSSPTKLPTVEVLVPHPQGHFRYPQVAVLHQVGRLMHPLPDEIILGRRSEVALEHRAEMRNGERTSFGVPETAGT